MRSAVPMIALVVCGSVGLSYLVESKMQAKVSSACTSTRVAAAVMSCHQLKSTLRGLPSAASSDVSISSMQV